MGKVLTLQLVDLMLGAQQSVSLPDPSEPQDTASHAAAGACSVALALSHYLPDVCVIAPSGGQLGKELFRCAGGMPEWDSLGRFLAVADDRDVRVLDGATGVPLACWRAPDHVWEVHWLPDSSGLAVEALDDRTRRPSSFYVLRFSGCASSEQPELEGACGSVAGCLRSEARM